MLKVHKHLVVLALIEAVVLAAILLLRDDSYLPVMYIDAAALYLLLASALLASGFLFCRRLSAPGRYRQEQLSGRRRESLQLAAIIAVAALLRLPFVTFGFPYFPHPDEGPKAEIVARMLENGSFDPHYFLHPSLLLYLSRELSALFAGAGVPLDAVHRSLLAGRSVSALAGVTSVFLTFLIARRLFSSAAGLIAAFLLSVAPLDVTCSRYMKEDALCVAFVLAAVFFIVRALQQERERDFFLAAFLSGCACASKYSGIVTIALFFAAPWLRSRSLRPDWHQVRVSLICLLIIPLGFLLCCPYALLDSKQFVANFLVERNHMLSGHNRIAISATSQLWMYHFSRSIIPGMTLVPALLAVFGLGMLLAGRSENGLFVLGMVLLFYLPAEWVKAKPPPQPERYVLPCVPFLCMAAAFALSCAARVWKSAGPAVVIFLVCILPASRSIALARDLRFDTRDQLRLWVAENLPAGTKVIIEAAYSPQLTDVALHRKLIKLDKHPGQFTVHALRNSGYEYLLVNSFSYGRYFREPKVNQLLKKRWANIFSTFPLVQEFSAPSGSYGFHNPVVRVYRLTPILDTRQSGLFADRDHALAD